MFWPCCPRADTFVLNCFCLLFRYRVMFTHIGMDISHPSTIRRLDPRRLELHAFGVSSLTLAMCPLKHFLPPLLVRLWRRRCCRSPVGQVTHKGQRRHSQRTFWPCCPRADTFVSVGCAGIVSSLFILGGTGACKQHTEQRLVLLGWHQIYLGNRFIICYLAESTTVQKLK